MPWHRKLRYPMAFSAASLASAATIDIIIPPSIPLILFALSANASIAALFYAGVLPGLLLCGGFMFACWWVGKRRNLPRETAPRDRVAFRRNLWHSAPALALPVLIVIFLRFGFATPTEVSILSTLYAGLVSALMYRDLSLKRLHHAVLEAGLATGRGAHRAVRHHGQNGRHQHGEHHGVRNEAHVAPAQQDQRDPASERDQRRCEHLLRVAGAQVHQRCEHGGHQTDRQRDRLQRGQTVLAVRADVWHGWGLRCVDGGHWRGLAVFVSSEDFR
jgi:hypothetical protein